MLILKIYLNNNRFLELPWSIENNFLKMLCLFCSWTNQNIYMQIFTEA